MTKEFLRDGKRYLLSNGSPTFIPDRVVPGVIAADVARVVGLRQPGQMPAKEAALTLMACPQLPILPRAPARRVPGKSSAQRRAERIAAGKLQVVDGKLVGA